MLAKNEVSTKRLAAERELLAEIVDTIPHMIWVANPDGEVEYYNRRFVEYTGEVPGDTLNERCRYLIHPHDLEGAAAKWSQVISAGEPFEIELRMRRRDGQFRWLLSRAIPQKRESGQITRWFGTFSDIEDRKRNEAVLLERDERFRILSEATGGAAWDWDMQTGEVWWGDGLRVLFGYDPAAPGQDVKWWEECIHPDDRGRVLDGLRAAVAGETLYVTEYRFRRSDGTFAHVLSRASLLRDREGPSIRMVGAMLDFTARRDLEEQLRQSQKMEAIGRLAAGIAHDFNNMLTVINGYSEIMVNALPAGDSLQVAVTEIRRAGERSAKLTQQLLAFSRRQILAPRVVSVNEVVRESERMLRRILGEDICLVTDLAPSLGSVHIDPDQLEQVLLNLAVNARDAMPTGGILTITSDIASLSESRSGLPNGDYVTLRVADTGCGMDAATQARIFEPFFTTKPIGQGTGLGLAAVHGAISQSGGFVEVFSEVGRGTVFAVYLPSKSDNSIQPTSAPPIRECAPGVGTILVVEDEDAVRDLLRQILETAGYSVLTAADGPNAVQLAAQHPSRIDLLITDVVMRGLGGRQVAEKLSEARPGLAVLFVSGYTDDEMVRHGIEIDRVHFLQKPFSPIDLARRVRDILEEEKH